MVLSRLLDVVTAGRRPTVVQLFRRAGQYRDTGRFEEAAELVAEGLRVEPESTVGHLLAGSLHAVFREMSLARASFERVLTIEATQPRALLGMARIALEEGNRESSAGHLERALERYPDFPEARALLEVVRSLETSAAPAAAPTVTVRVDRLRPPAECRELLLTLPDGALLAAVPRGLRSQESAARLARVSRLAGAMLARAKLGGPRHAAIEGSADTTFIRTDESGLLCLTLPRDPDLAPGLVHLERVWSHCALELQGQVA